MDIKVIVGSIVRHGLSALGAFLVAAGYVSADEVSGLVEVVSGAVIALGTVGWSVYRTKKLGA
jgi:hypothetical protein